MLQSTQPTYDIQRVRDVQPCEGGMQLVFATGLTVWVRKEHPEYERLVGQARSSIQCGEPVGIVIGDPGGLLELNDAHQSAVRLVQPDSDDSSRVMVEFWAYSPICYLTKDHPEFERILQTLERAATMEEQVVFANHKQMVEGESETWWKILDVRQT